LVTERGRIDGSSKILYQEKSEKIQKSDTVFLEKFRYLLKNIKKGKKNKDFKIKRRVSPITRLSPCIKMLNMRYTPSICRPI
jgi:hypothetical protein